MRPSVLLRLVSGGTILSGLLLVAILVMGSVWQHPSARAGGDTLTVADTTTDLITGMLPNTAALYATHCSACHGESGQGDGAAAYLLYPKPRDFTSGIFRFKSTAASEPPTRQDLARVIREGIERTAMPSFVGVLNDQQIEGMIDHVLALSGQAASKEDAALAISAKPPFDAKLVSAGKAVYAAASCGACHGNTGRGDGPSSLTLKDSQDFPLPPADFTTGVFKAGRKAEDLYRTIMVGVPGTPMPSYASGLAELPLGDIGVGVDRGWALVAYLRSLELSQQPQGARADAVISAAQAVAAPMLNNPWHDAWQAIEPLTVSLQPLWQRKAAPRAASLRVVRHGEDLAFCIEWADNAPDSGATSVSTFSDAVAIMFSLGNQAPALVMGTSGGPESQRPVNVWHWQALRQLNATHDRLHDVPELMTGAPSDGYPFKQGEPVSGRISEHNRTYLPAMDVGNPKSMPELIGRAALESNAAGFGTLTLQTPDEQHLGAVGSWSNGNWRVVMVRSLKPQGDGDVNLNDSGRIPFAVAVWDGSAGDRNGTKLISGWHWLVTH
jgi:mono/diheme cytochrome c family protein